MAAPTDDALLILRHMLEEPFSTHLSDEALMQKVGLEQELFIAAQRFLYAKQYITGGSSSEGGWSQVTEAGVDWHDFQMRGRVRLSLTAETLLRFVATQNYTVTASEAREKLAISEGEYLAAAQELADLKLLAEGRRRIGELPLARIDSTSEGRNLVRQGFRLSSTASSPTYNVGNVIGTVQGGNVQGVGYADGSTVSQVVNDPQLLARELDARLTALINAVRADLTADQLGAYEQTAEELKTELQSKEPRPGVIKKLLGSLAFFADIEGTVALATRAWDALGPIIPLAFTILQNVTR